MSSNMKAELLFRKREGLTETAFVELVVWRVLEPVRGSAHAYKYSLALVSEGVCVLRYDNETGKATTSTSSIAKSPIVSSIWPRCKPTSGMT
jgi:hypothetical protein